MKLTKLVNHIINALSLLATIMVVITTLLAVRTIQPTYNSAPQQVLGEKSTNVLEITDLNPNISIIDSTNLIMQDENNFIYNIKLNDILAANYSFNTISLVNSTDHDYTVYISASTQPELSSLQIYLIAQGVTLPLKTDNNVLSAEILVPSKTTIPCALKLVAKNDINIASNLKLTITAVPNNKSSQE